MGEKDAGDLIWYEGSDYARFSKDCRLSICVQNKGATLHIRKWLEAVQQQQPNNRLNGDYKSKSLLWLVGPEKYQKIRTFLANLL